MLKKLICVFFCDTSYYSYAQNVLKGNVKDERGNPADNVNLILYPKLGNTILAYTTTNNLGNFMLSYASNADSLRLELNSLSYEKKQFFLVNKTIPSLTISLKTAINNLPEIVIKDERPISQKGDTINYNAKSFAYKNDRVIIDVIKKLPGITVTDGGQILYQNKAINKFYVDGKDLLEDRYSIASNNLPIDAVDFVQLLQNHQPISVLDGVVQTDRAAINIQLNKNAKLRLLGNGNVGLGVSPFLRDNNLTLLKFAKKTQYINSLKNNNIGLYLDKEIAEQNFNQIFFESGSIKQDLLSLVKASPPPVNQFRYWFNNNTLANSNYLIGLSKLFVLKFNVSFVNDNLADFSNTITQIYLPTDTIVINENQSGNNAYSKLITAVILEANTKKLYLKNSLKFQRIWSTAKDFISSTSINQNLNNPFINLTNELSGIVNLKNNLVGLNSFTSYTNLPQQLTINPGQYPNLLNAGVAYDGLLQKVQLKGFFTNNSASFAKKIGSFSLNNKFGVLVQLRKLSNNLIIEQGGLFTPTNASFNNLIARDRLVLYNEATLGYSNRKFNMALNLNASANVLSNKGQNITQNATKFFVNPNLNLRYNISSFWENSINLRLSNDMVYDANPSFILQNYRSLINSDVPLRETLSRSITYDLRYKNIINAVYANFNLSYSKNIANILIENNFNNTLITQTAFVRDNPTTNLKITANINKYYLALKTGFDVALSYTSIGLTQIQQGILSDFKNNNKSLSTKINTKVSKSFNLIHALNIIKSRNTITQNNKQNTFDPITFLSQSLTLNVFLPKEISLKASLEHYFNDVNKLNAVNYFFADLTLQKSVPKPKLDFSVVVLNVFNTKSYTSYIYSNNFLINSNYTLRGRMLMLKAGFQF